MFDGVGAFVSKALVYLGGQYHGRRVKQGSSRGEGHRA